MNPKTYWLNPISATGCPFMMLRISTAVAPKMAGIANKNEKLTASMADHPRILAADMVDPLRETPGKIANAWKRPMNKASDHLFVFNCSVVFSWPNLIPAYKMAAVVMKKNPSKWVLSNRDLMGLSIKTRGNRSNVARRI